MKGDMTFADLFIKSWDIFKSKFVLFASLAFVFSYLPNVIFGWWTLYKGFFQKAGDMTPSLTEVLQRLWSIAPWIIILEILSVFLMISLIYFLSMNTKKKILTFGEVLDGSSSFYLKGILLGLLLVVFLIPLYLLFIIPGIIFGIYWTFAIFVLIEEKCSVTQSLRKSREIVKGRWWRVFGYLILLLLILSVIQKLLGWIFILASPLVTIVFTNIITSLTSVFSIIFLREFYVSLKRKS